MRRWVDYESFLLDVLVIVVVAVDGIVIIENDFFATGNNTGPIHNNDWSRIGSGESGIQAGCLLFG